MSELVRALKEHSQMLAVIREYAGVRSLLAHSQATVNKGALLRDDGSYSTIVTMGVQDERLNNGRETIIPTLWDGKIITDRETNIRNALQSGRKWPSADSIEEAQFIDDYAHVEINKQVPVGETDAT